MMRNRKHLFVNTTLIVFSLTTILGITSCQKEDTSEFVSQAEIVADYVRAEDYMADLFGLMHSSIYDTALINNGQALIDSIFVTYQVDTLTGFGIFLYDFDSPNQPAGTAQVYSGQVTATLFGPFTNAGAVMKANFYNFMVGSYQLQGMIYYQNTGETVDGNRKYLLQYYLDMSLNNQLLLSYVPARDLFWTAGFDTPLDYQDDEFLLTGGALATYHNPTDYGTTVTIDAVFVEDWVIGISCYRYFRSGIFEAVLSNAPSGGALNGEFIDADYDNCADKVMIKNSDKSLGYPYYL
jgi:hypothetical protein